MKSSRADYIYPLTRCPGTPNIIESPIAIATQYLLPPNKPDYLLMKNRKKTVNNKSNKNELIF